MLHIVDDEEVIRDALCWLAQSRGIEAAAYESADAFLKMLEGRPHFDPGGDCLLLDIRMPVTSGIALFEMLDARALTARLPVIFLTGHGDVPMAVSALKRGAFDFSRSPLTTTR